MQNPSLKPEIRNSGVQGTNFRKNYSISIWVTVRLLVHNFKVDGLTRALPCQPSFS